MASCSNLKADHGLRPDVVRRSLPVLIGIGIYPSIAKAVILVTLPPNLSPIHLCRGNQAIERVVTVALRYRESRRAPNRRHGDRIDSEDCHCCWSIRNCY